MMIIPNVVTRLAGPVAGKLIGWQRNVVNAVMRNMFDKMSDTINVCDFGAKLDGVTDDTDYLQAAINHAGVGNPFDGRKAVIVLKFVPGTTCFVNRTLYLPSFVVLDLNGCLLTGDGTNTGIETGYWLNGQVVSNTGQADETQFVVCSGVRNGSMSNFDRAFNLLNFCEGSSLRGLRFVNVNQVFYARHCFYGAFEDLHARSPLVADKYPAYHWDGEVNGVKANSIFGVAFQTTFRKSGNADNLMLLNCGAEQGSVGVDVHGPTYALTVQGCYFEDLITAINFDPDGNHENVNIDGCSFITTTNAVGGNNVTGTWGRHNKRNGAAMNLPANFTNRLRVATPTDSSPDNATYALPDGYQLGDTCEVDYVRAIYDSQSGAVAVKGHVHAGVMPRVFGGDVGAPVANQIPFCTTTLTATTLTVDTQIRYRSGAWIGMHLTITASGTQEISALWNNGTLMAVQKSAVVVSAANNNGYYQFTVTGLTAATAVTGEIELLNSL